MKLAHKLTAGALLAALLIWVVGLYAITVSRRALEDSIEHSSTMLAANLMDEVDRAIHAAIDDWLIYSASPLVQRTLKASNQEFEKLQDVQAHIDRQEEHWRSVPKETVTAFMKSLLTSELSEALRTRLDAFERDEGYKAYGEVFLTNRYGANAAQTGKTTDYRQDDEQWWLRAREDGVYVADVQYDKSAGVYSTDICVRVDDENGDFLGVIKAVFDIEGIFAILRSRMSGPQCRAGGRSPPHLILLTADRRVIFPPHGSSVGLLDGSSFLQPHDHSHPGRVHADHFHRHDEKLGEMIGWCALSRGHDEFKGLGWVLIVEHRAEDFLAPVATLRWNILMISAGVTVASLVLGLWFSISMSRRITRLKNAALRVGRGELNSLLGDKTADEIGEFSGCFDRMTQQLSETLVSKASLEKTNRALEAEIVARKRAEEALRKSEGKYRLLVENIPLKVFHKDRNSVYVSCNEAYAQDLGTSASDMPGKTDHDLYPKELAEKYVADDARIMETGRPAVLEERYVAHGEEFIVQTFKVPVRDEAGNVIGLLGVFHNITERKRIQQEIEDLAKFPGENRFPVLRIARDGTLLYANAASESLLGEWETAIGRPVPDRWRGIVARVLGRGSEEAVEVQHADRILSLMLVPVTDAGYVNVYGRDITQRKRAEEALATHREELERSNAELEQFAYVASHDLQEPLRMISGYVKMLERRYKGQLDADADDFIGFAVDGAERMAVLINDLLAYSRVTRRGKAFEPTDCETVMDEVLANLEVAVTETGATVTHDPLPTVVADEVQLGRLLRNLIGNAIKYHGEEPPKVHVSAEQIGGGWRFAVRDNGIGIEPQYHERIFAVFQRLHARGEYGGTGIGLAIARKIVQRHGGRIWVESEPGKGSTFYFTVPRREAETDDESTDHAADEAYANAGQAGGGPSG